MHLSQYAPGTLEVASLECLRGDELVFQGLTFSVQGGEVLQVLGANGSGKTSLLRILGGLASASEGRIVWRNHELTAADSRWRGELLYVSHASGVTHALTVEENLRLAFAMAARPAVAALPAVLDRVGLAHAGHALAGRLSAGQRQRVALARLLLIPAAAWLLDEPLTALDSAGKALVEALLTDHASRGGLAIVATHQALDLPSSLLRTLQLASALPG